MIPARDQIEGLGMRRRDFVILLAGAMAGRPSPVRAQQKAMPVIGLLISSSGTKPTFLQGLSEAGYDSGQNVKIDYRNAEGEYDQLPAMAADLVRRRVAVIAAFEPPRGCRRLFRLSHAAMAGRSSIA